MHLVKMFWIPVFVNVSENLDEQRRKMSIFQLSRFREENYINQLKKGRDNYITIPYSRTVPLMTTLCYGIFSVSTVYEVVSRMVMHIY